jgi:peptide/nickel transport system substrate-binding protein
VDMKRKRWLLPVLGLALAMIAISCTSNNSSSSSSSGSTTPQVMTIATTAAVTTWDPSQSFSTEATYMPNIYEGLLVVNPPGSADAYTPVLATSWEHSTDGLTWTWHLRDGITFHDGTAFDANAARKSIDWMAKNAAASFIWAPLESVKVKDASTIEMDLSYAAPMELIAGSTYAAWMVSPTAIDAASSDKKYFESGKDAGTGPYTISSYTPDEEVDLKAYPDYWGGWDGAHVSDVVMKIVSDATQQQQMLDGGQVDLATRVPPESLATYSTTPGFAVTRDASWFNYTAFFNTLRTPLNDPKVRQALSYAIPYQDIIDVAVLGYGSQSFGAVPKGVYPFSDQIPQYSTDLTKAASMLADAGYPNGGFDLKLTYASENPVEAKIAPLIQDSFKQIGVNVQVKAILFNQQWEAAKSDPANAQDIFLLLYWPTYADAGTDNLYSMFHCADPPFFNLSYWCNKTFDKDIDTAATLEVTDPQKAQDLYDQAQTIMVNDAPAGFLIDTEQTYAMTDRVQGFVYNENYPFSFSIYNLSLS